MDFLKSPNNIVPCVFASDPHSVSTEIDAEDDSDVLFYTMYSLVKSEVYSTNVFRYYDCSFEDG
jgi:hypothetical protein